MVYSGAPGDMRCKRSSSLLAALSASSGIWRFVHFFAQLVHLLAALVAFAEFLLDGLHLLAQIIVALGLVDL